MNEPLFDVFLIVPVTILFQSCYLLIEFDSISSMLIFAKWQMEFIIGSSDIL